MKPTYRMGYTTALWGKQPIPRGMFERQEDYLAHLRGWDAGRAVREQTTPAEWREAINRSVRVVASSKAATDD